MVTDGKTLEKVAMVVPAKRAPEKTKRKLSKLSPPRAKPGVKRRSVLGEDKHSPSGGEAWKEQARFVALYKAIVDEPIPFPRRLPRRVVK